MILPRAIRFEVFFDENLGRSLRSAVACRYNGNFICMGLKKTRAMSELFVQTVNRELTVPFHKEVNSKHCQILWRTDEQQRKRAT